MTHSKVDVTIALVREAFPNNGAEGETVHLLCNLVELLTRELRDVCAEAEETRKCHALYEHGIAAEHARLATIVDEACGVQPVLPADELLSLVETRLHELRVALTDRDERLEKVSAWWTGPRSVASVGEVADALSGWFTREK